MSRTSSLISLVTLLLLVAPTHAQQGTGTVSVSPDVKPAVRNRRTLAECVRLALTHSPSIEGSAAASAEATAMRRSARGRFGPVVRIEANVLRWSAPFALPIDIPVPAPLGPPDVAPRVLDAQSLLHATRLREASAGHGGLQAQVRWRRARGLDPVAIEGDVR